MLTLKITKMERTMAKKKQLNEEAAALCKVLKLALAMTKEAEVVTHNGNLVCNTPVGIIYMPAPFDVQVAVRADELYNALNNCDSPFNVVEHGNALIISWGKRRAELRTRPKVSIYVGNIDPKAAIEIPDNFSDIIRDGLKDLKEGHHAASDFIRFTNGAAFWTNGVVGCMITTGVGFPDRLLRIKDVKVISSKEEKIVAVGGSVSTITFYYEDDIAIQIPTADESTVNYPDAIKNLFSPDVYAERYELTDEHIDAIEYVSKFAENIMHISPEHVGTDADKTKGTAVDITGIDINIALKAEIVKLGGFKKAKYIIANALANKNRVGFYTYRDNVTFCFVQAV